MNAIGVFDLPGGPFLELYGVLFAFTIFLGLIIPRLLRREGRAVRNPGFEQFAYLAGGKTRFVDAVVARMLSTGQLLFTGKKFEAATPMGGETPAERSVFSLSQPAKWSAVEHAVGRHAGAVRDRLIDDDMLLSGGAVWRLRILQTLPYLLLFGFGWIKLTIGQARERPVGYLTLLLALTAIFAVLRFALVERRTRAGLEALHDARAHSDRLRRAPASGETGMAVALFGTVVLAGSGWADFHQMRSASSGDGGSGGGDSGSSGDGGGGCGGGGCGGCGS